MKDQLNSNNNNIDNFNKIIEEVFKIDIKIKEYNNLINDNSVDNNKNTLQSSKSEYNSQISKNLKTGLSLKIKNIKHNKNDIA